MFQKFPYTNNHQLNLDWIIKIIKLLKGGFKGQVLIKQSSKDYDFAWGTSGGVPIESYEALEDKPTLNGIEISGDKTSADYHLTNIPYADLTNKPTLNGVEISGNKTNSDYHIPTKTSDLTDDTLIYKTNVQVSPATNDEIIRITDSKITNRSFIISCDFANPNYIESDVTWTSNTGYISFVGTCSSSTSAKIIIHY